MIPHVDDSKQKGDEESFDFDNAKEVAWYHKLLLNRPLKVLFVAVCLAIVAPLLLYHYVFFPSLDLPPSDGYSIGSCLLPRTARLLCGIGIVNSTECDPQCCYDFDSHVCFHRFPSRFTYILDEETWTENATMRARVANTPFNSKESLPEIKLSIDEISSTHVALTFYNAQQLVAERRRLTEKNYTHHVSTPELNIIVNDTLGNNMFNTMRGPIIAAEDIWEIAFKMTNESMYGLGEIPLQEGTVKVLYNHEEGFSGIPLIFSANNGTYHGLLIDVKEPTEVRIEGENLIAVRSITKLGLKFHLFSGPSPHDIMKNVKEIIAFKKKLQYWMLGAHVCSEHRTDAYENLSTFLADASRDKLPFDSHCGSAPVVFDNNQCEESDERNNLEEDANLIRSYKKRFVPHVSPHILFEKPNTTEAEDNSTEIIKTTSSINCSNILTEYENLMLMTQNSTELYVGEIRNFSAAYPDYRDTDIEFIKKLWVDTTMDGVVLENTWPLDESLKHHNETYDLLPYFNKNFERAFNKTPQWNITRPQGKMYIYTHNQYGNHFADAFRHLSNDTPLWISSQWMGGDIVNRQNIDTSWTNLHKQLTEAALGGISGHWLWTSPICGDTENFNITTQSSLCVKWYMAATYFPLIKIHSKTTQRDPLSFTGTNKMHILTALYHRTSLLPYIFTTLQTGPLLRPMFYQFPSSKAIRDLNTQFSVGEDLLIVPNLQPSQSHVHIYMPPGVWYELWSGLLLDEDEGEVVTMTTTESDFLTLIRGGSIVVMQKDVNDTADETRLNSDFSLTIALQCHIGNVTETFSENDNDTECHAKGNIYFNDNITLIFEANNEDLIITAKGKDLRSICDTQDAESAHRIKEINIYGLTKDLNNYDHHKHVATSIDLCELQSEDEVVFNYVN